MRMAISFHGITRPSARQLRAMFNQQAARIDRHLGSFQEDLVRLEGHVEKIRNRRLYRVSLRLKLPSGVLAVGEEDHDLRAILSKAFDELERRTEKHMARLRGQHTWRRVAERLAMADSRRPGRPGRADEFGRAPSP